MVFNLKISLKFRKMQIEEAFINEINYNLFEVNQILDYNFIRMILLIYVEKPII